MTRRTTENNTTDPAARGSVRSHDGLLAAILARCEGRNLWPVVTNPARFNQRAAGNKGFPDVMIIGPGGIIFRELKTDAAPNLRPEQTEWKYRLQGSGQDWDTWTWGDLDSGHIDDELNDLETPDEYTNTWALLWLTQKGLGETSWIKWRKFLR